MYYPLCGLCNVDIMMSYLFYGQYMETASPCQEDDDQFRRVPSIHTKNIQLCLGVEIQTPPTTYLDLGHIKIYSKIIYPDPCGNFLGAEAIYTKHHKSASQSRRCRKNYSTISNWKLNKWKLVSTKHHASQNFKISGQKMGGPW